MKYFLKPINSDFLSNKKIKLPAFKSPKIKKTLIFDLDETLVHCIEDYINVKTDHIIKVKFPNGEEAKAGINIRPWAGKCLKRAAEMF